MNRRLIIRTGVVLLFVALAFFLYTTGKGSALLLDNRTVELNGKTYEAFATVRISVNGAEPVELYPRDRDQANVTGGRHRISVTVFDRGGREVEKKEASIRLSGKSRMYLLSLPAFVGGEEGWLTEFTPGQ